MTPTDDLSQHPLYPHVRSWRDETGTSFWGLGERKILWSKEARWREDALRIFLFEMTSHEVMALIRELGAERPQC